MKQFYDELIETTGVSGMITYEDHYPGTNVSEVRMVIKAYVSDNEEATPFIVDTWAPWCVLDPKIVLPLVEHRREVSTWSVDYVIQEQIYHGKIYTVPITLIDQYKAEHNLEIEASVFVPTLQPDEEWHHPNVLGLQGFLNRMRFAVDPEEHALYFGRR